MPHRPQPLILLVEDNRGDVDLALRAFRDQPVHIEVVRDGEAALLRLFDSSLLVPDVVLLDLNLPKVSGVEVLEQLKRSELTKAIPVVVLTSSEAESDVLMSYARHANSYIVKPATPDKVFSQVFFEYWFKYGRTPPRR